MTTSARWILLPACAGALLACLLMTGCAANPGALKPGAARAAQFSYQPTPAPFKIDASARVEASVTLAPELRPLWERWFGKGPTVDACFTAMAGAVTADIAGSGLFTRVQQAVTDKPDFLVRIQARESDLANLRLQATIQLIDAASGKELFSRNATMKLDLSADDRGNITFTQAPKFPADYMNGKGWSGRHLLTGSMQHACEQLMPVLKAGVAGYFQNAGEESAARKMQTASLPELITGTDRSVTMARERNRLLIAAKNQQLSQMLRERKTDELTSLVIQIEQAILDLNHESEMAKDRAQQAAAANDSPAQVEEARGLGLSFRERIELLKPILAALKEEIANRNR